jgi:hypothetical protein
MTAIVYMEMGKIWDYVDRKWKILNLMPLSKFACKVWEIGRWIFRQFLIC